MNYASFVAALAKPLPTRRNRVEHALLGVIGELGELVDAHKKHLIYGKEFDKTNFVEELGDFRFYLQMFYNEKFDKHESDVLLDVHQSLFQMTIHVGKLTRSILSGEEKLAEIELMHLNGVWKNLCQCVSMLPDEVIRLNMEKLSKRYPNISYSDEHAIQRLDKQ